uniref:Lipocalin n=1 Tax=Rhipicephalus zambeziensis TaxID=60191 RepID=A0A224YH09_9ACAR
MHAVALFLVFGLFVNVHGATLDDLINALNTTSPVWTVTTNYLDKDGGETVMCDRWQLKNLSRTGYSYDYSYKNGSQYFDKGIINATLNSEGSMNVPDEASGISTLYTLIHWDTNGKCFVLTRSKTSQIRSERSAAVQCEVHVWHEYVNQNISNLCHEAYKKKCGEEKHQVFFDDQCL